MESEKERMKKDKINEISPKFFENLSQKGDPCENAHSNPLFERV